MSLTGEQENRRSLLQEALWFSGSPAGKDLWFLLALVLAAISACSGTWPSLPTRGSDDCVFFTITAPRTLAVGASAALGAFQESCRPMFLPLNPNTITWQSLDPNVLSVIGTSVAGVAPGVAVVQGTFGKSSSQAIVTVGGSQPGAGTMTRLRLVGPPAMAVGQRSSFVLIEEQSNATFVDVTDPINWHSSNPDIVGILTASANRIEIHAWQSGSATITATTNAGRMAAVVSVAAR